LNAFEFLYPKSMLRTFVALFENKVIGIRIELIYKELIFDWYAGHDEVFNNKYPNDFLIFNVLRWGSLDSNLLEFDFGGAGKRSVPYGVRDYKSKFGGDLIEFGRFFRINRPLIFTFSKIGFYLFKKIIKYGLRSKNK
jgi:lipid II:glycine glycyltransferase (peptidoglycan interpeptide bridge formation enzyme)